jgi:hypothetical protein
MIVEHVDVVNDKTIHKIDTDEHRKGWVGGQIRVTVGDMVFRLSEEDGTLQIMKQSNGEMYVQPIVGNVVRIGEFGE